MIYSLFVVCYFASIVVAHPLKNIFENPKLLQHSMVLHHCALLNTMNESFPSDPSYLIVQITSDMYNCAQTSALGYASYLLNACLTTDSSSSMFITCGKKVIRI